MGDTTAPTPTTTAAVTSTVKGEMNTCFSSLFIEDVDDSITLAIPVTLPVPLAVPVVLFVDSSSSSSNTVDIFIGKCPDLLVIALLPALALLLLLLSEDADADDDDEAIGGGGSEEDVRDDRLDG